MGLAHDLHNGDGSHSDVGPRSVATVVFHSTQILDRTPKAQRRIQRTLDQIHDPSRQLPPRTPTVVLEQLLSTSDPNQSCNVDWNAPRTPQEPLRPAASRHAPATAQQARAKRSAPKRLRRPRRRKRRSDKRLCSSTIEESSSLANRVNSQRKRVRCYKETTPCTSIIHIHLNTYTFHSHDTSSHRTLHHERATIHCSVTRSLRLETDGKYESGQLSSAWTQLSARGPRTYAGIRVGEPQKSRASHTRERLDGGGAAPRHSPTDQRSWRLRPE